MTLSEEPISNTKSIHGVRLGFILLISIHSSLFVSTKAQSTTTTTTTTTWDLHANDTAAWKQLQKDLDSQSWFLCGDPTTDPCSHECPRVICKDINDETHISQIELQGNNIKEGILSSATLELFSQLDYIDISDNSGIVVTDGPWMSRETGNICFDFKGCNDETVKCILPDSITLCRDTDLGGWETLYDQTTGEHWKECSEFRSDPCKCGHVVCDFDYSLPNRPMPTSITHIVMQNNSLVGRITDDFTLNWNKLEKLRIEQNSEIEFDNYNSRYRCEDVFQQCSRRDVDCGSPTALQSLSKRSAILCPYTDLGSWREFYDLMHVEGQEWRSCENYRDDPCRCSRSKIECDKAKRIKKIILNDIGLNGTFPSHVFDRFQRLSELSLENRRDDSTTPNEVRPISQDLDRGCLPIAACLSGDMKCTVNTIPPLEYCLPTMPRPEFPLPTNLYYSDLVAWQGLYDSMYGENWIDCSDKREDPCSCDANKRVRVTCTNKRIDRIYMQNNNVVMDEIKTEFVRALPNLEIFRFNNPARSNKNTYDALPGTVCKSIPECASDIVCNLPDDFLLCHDTPAPTISPTKRPTNAPTQRPTVAHDDLRGWQALYDFAGGPNWIHCSENRENPCECNGGSRQRVVCDGNWIKKIILQDNNLVASVLPMYRVNLLKGLTEFRIDNTDGVKDGEANMLTGYGPAGEPCINMPLCAEAHVDCSAPDDVIYCYQTPSPTFPITDAPTPSGVHPDDFAFWRALYRQTDGDNWRVDCDIEDPCSCGNEGGDAFVSCHDWRIVDIVLPNNNMTGVFPSAEFQLVNFLNRIILTSDVDTITPNVFLNDECLLSPGCSDLYTKSCNFDNTGIVYCAVFEPTPGPSRAPSSSPTNSPTTGAPSLAPSDAPSRTPTSIPTIAPIGAPTFAPQDYFVRVRYVEANFNATTRKEKMHLDIFAKTFPAAKNTQILAVTEGSVIVDFKLGKYTGAPLDSLSIRQALLLNMPQELRMLLVPRNLIRVEYVGTQDEANWPTLQPTAKPSVSPTTYESSKFHFGELEIAAIALGGVAAIALCVFLCCMCRSRKETPMQKKLSWRERHVERKSSWRLPTTTDEEMDMDYHEPFQPNSKIQTSAPRDVASLDLVLVDQQQKEDHGQDDDHDEVFHEMTATERRKKRNSNLSHDSRGGAPQQHESEVTPPFSHSPVPFENEDATDCDEFTIDDVFSEQEMSESDRDSSGRDGDIISSAQVAVDFGDGTGSGSFSRPSLSSTAPSPLF